MPEIDARAILLGFGLGLVASSLFFAGLAWGLRHALRRRHPAPILAASFLLRAALLVGAAWWLARTANPVAALPAYLLAFFLVRSVALRLARRSPTGQPTLAKDR